MLRHGTAYGEFTELATKSPVGKAFSRRWADGHRPTVSAASARMGLTRQDAKRLQGADPETEAGTSGVATADFSTGHHRSDWQRITSCYPKTRLTRAVRLAHRGSMSSR